MERYHPLLVTLHWVMALMVLISLVAGGLILENMADDNPDKILALTGHMSAGMVIGALLILRLVTRLRTRTPPRATTGNASLDRIAYWTHRGFYVLIAGMVLTGLATALGAGLFPIVFGGAAQAEDPKAAARAIGNAGNAAAQTRPRSDRDDSENS